MTEPACPFCAPEATRIFHAGQHIVGIWDRFPVSPGHALLIPKRHVASWFDASDEERAELLAGVAVARDAIEREQPSQPDGYNIGVNVDVAAGQTVPHLHVHLIPRYQGDMDDPRGGVRHVIPERGNYLAAVPDPGLSVADREDRAGGGAAPGELINAPHRRALIAGAEDPLLPHLRAHLDAAKEADIAVAFVLESGLAELEEHFADLLRRNGRLRLLAGDYLGVTDPRALRRLLDLQNEFPHFAEMRVVEVRQGSSFHPKSYILRSGSSAGIALVGSSNMSKTGLGASSGIEWSYRAITSRDEDGFRDVAAGFERLFRSPSTHALTDEWIDRYEKRRDVLRSAPAREIAPADEAAPPPPTPHEIQTEALDALVATRVEGYRAGLVVMATGLGKTWLAAFDSERPEFRRILFVAHREEILRQSLATFRAIRPQAHLGLYTGQEKTPEADILFASVQTLGKKGHLDRFPRDHFDYIVVDEFHHASARTYRQLIHHFEPGFLLGLTATPERLDGSDILALCQDNLVYRCDAPRAISRKRLSPFHYFGVPDEVDYKNIPWRNSKFDEAALTDAVATRSRAQNALEQWEQKGGKHTLAFCCSVRHANFMRDYFREAGVAAAAVHSGVESDPRAASLEQLEAGEIKILFAVDIFNEGVDLPHVDTVLMLRPTESPVIWMQQFGRGLRLAEGKDHLTVLDYIGNHRIFLLKIQALHNLDPGDANIRRVLQLVQAGELELPEGCEVTYDLRAVEILQALLKKGSSGAEILELWYRDARERHGERPTAGQAVREGYNPRAMRTQYGSWLRFVNSMGDLTPTQAELVREGASAEFLAELETTQMTRSFKMLVLQAMIEVEALQLGADIGDLVEAVAKLARRSPRVRADLGVDPGDAKALQRKLEENPIEAWVGGRGTGGRNYFVYESGRFEFASGGSVADWEGFSGLVGEVVDWRLAEYFRRDSVQADIDRFTCKVSHSGGGQPILFLPDREKNPDLPSGWAPVIADGESYEANFVKIAVNVMRRPDTNENVLPSVLTRWFGEHAGQSGTSHEVAFEPQGGDVWVMRPATSDDGQPDAEIGRSYMRAEIPPRFGLAFHQQRWQQGFVFEGGQIFLLVTLDKAGMPEAHQYGDRFLTRELFEWKSQNRHTQAGKHGQAMHNHLEQGIPIHLFVRKKGKLGGSKAAPFVYLGEVDFVDWEGEKPITIRWKLRAGLSATLWEMLGDPQ